jgi:molybdopterin-guanine dinucleotide biosynthesis protein A
MADPSPTIPRFSAGVLAGGRSLRMGTDKAFLRIDGELLIERQLHCLQECGASEILISGRMEVDYSALGHEVVYDQLERAGPLAGLASLMAASSFTHLLVVAVDMPQMTSGLLRKIVGQCDEIAGCVPIDQFGLQPLAAVYPTSLLAVAEQCLLEGRYAMGAFVTEAITRGMLRTMKVGPENEKCFTNWNSPSDWVH